MTDKTKPAFTVRIEVMTESHRKTYHVTLTNTALRPENCSPFDDTGRITPFFAENEEHAKHEAKEWAAFLGVPEQAQCSCVRCEPRSKPKHRVMEGREKEGKKQPRIDPDNKESKNENP